MYLFRRRQHRLGPANVCVQLRPHQIKRAKRAHNSAAVSLQRSVRRIARYYSIASNFPLIDGDAREARHRRMRSAAPCVELAMAPCFAPRRAKTSHPLHAAERMILIYASHGVLPGAIPASSLLAVPRPSASVTMRLAATDAPFLRPTEAALNFIGCLHVQQPPRQRWSGCRSLIKFPRRATITTPTKKSTTPLP